MDTAAVEELEIAERLTRDVLQPLKSAFVGKDEIVDLMGVCLVAGENLFLLGPPGTAKSALVRGLADRLDGEVFDYLLTRFTEPGELFGPFDIRKLREGELVTNTEGMLPEAAFVFLDELLNANSAILNSLLMVLNERVFRRGRETRQLPLLMVVGASNRLPEDDALGALFDRFLMRVHCGHVAQDQLQDVLLAGWRLDFAPDATGPGIRVDEIHRLQRLISQVDLSAVRGPYVDLIHRLRHAGIAVSDRRAVKLQRLIAASAILCGRLNALLTDMWVLRYIWDTEEQQSVLESLVQNVLDDSGQVEQPASHPRARANDSPDPESLARDLDRIGTRLAEEKLPEGERACLRDQLGILAPRCQWVVDEQQRTFLGQRVEELWKSLGEAS